MWLVLGLAISSFLFLALSRRFASRLSKTATRTLEVALVGAWLSLLVPEWSWQWAVASTGCAVVVYRFMLTIIDERVPDLLRRLGVPSIEALTENSQDTAPPIRVRPRVWSFECLWAFHAAQEIVRACGFTPVEQDALNSGAMLFKQVKIEEFANGARVHLWTVSSTSDPIYTWHDFGDVLARDSLSPDALGDGCFWSSGLVPGEILKSLSKCELRLSVVRRAGEQLNRHEGASYWSVVLWLYWAGEQRVSESEDVIVNVPLDPESLDRSAPAITYDSVLGWSGCPRGLSGERKWYLRLDR